MISVSAATRRAMISSSSRRSRTTMANNRVQQRLQSSLVVPLNSGISKQPSTGPVKHYFRRSTNTTRSSNSNNNRSLSSSTPPSSKPPTSAPSSSVNSKSGGGDKKVKTGTTEVIPNVILASICFGFVAGVFLYSMNAVGRGDGNASKGDDPLAQLKAEAQEAREIRGRVEGGGDGGRMTPDEIRALESGLDPEVDGERVAVAAPADIAAIEDEANLKIFRQQQNGEGQQQVESKKKKAWWRFGF